MEYFSGLSEFFCSLPWWCALVPPAAFVLFAVPLLFFRKRRAYRYLSSLCLTAEGLLSMGSGYVLLSVLLCAAAAILLYPLCLLPKRKRKSIEELGREIIGESEPTKERTTEKRPPKICCFEQPRGETAEERGMKLSHVITLLEKLKKEKLTPADRLEVEMLSRSVEGAETRPLTDEQTDRLSDDLSAVLRLMAKYS